MKIALSLLMYKKPEFTIKMLDTLFNSDIKNHNISLFVQDNSPDSCKPARDFIRKSGIEHNIFRSPDNENIGIVLSRIAIMNEILKQKFDYMLELHNDMIFCPNWFEELIKVREDKVGILCPYIFQSFHMDWTQQQMEEKCSQYREEKIDDNVIQTHPWLVNMNLVKEIGYYDPKYSPEQCEDDDFMYRAIKANWKTRATKMSWVGHIGGATRAGDPLILMEHLNYFYYKHKLTIPQFKQQYLTIHPAQY